MLIRRFLASGFWLLAAGFWLLAAGSWLLARGSWLLAAGGGVVARTRESMKVKNGSVGRWAHRAR